MAGAAKDHKDIKDYKDSKDRGTRDSDLALVREL